MRSEDELWKKYEEQKKIVETSEERMKPFEELVTSQLRRIGLFILEWVLGVSTGEKPSEEEIQAEYVKEIENRPRPQRGMMKGFPMQQRSVTSAWLGWVLGIPDDEIMTHQKQYTVK